LRGLQTRVINARHELILIRSRNDNNCLLGDSTLDPRDQHIQDTMANATRAVERDQKTIDAACSGKRTISQHGFLLVGSVRVSAIAAYHQAFVGH